MFHFPGCPPMRLWIHLMVTEHYLSRVPPFGYLRINVYLQLPAAFRSLSRPSSAISALASTLRSSSLDLASTATSFLRLLRQGRNLLICLSSSARALASAFTLASDFRFFPVQFSRCALGGWYPPPFAAAFLFPLDRPLNGLPPAPRVLAAIWNVE